MLYKILLTLISPLDNSSNQLKIAEKLVLNNWKKLGESNHIWIAEITANDYLSAKSIVERDLNLFFLATGLNEINYAFQLSLREISKGKLLQKQK
jgi:hypothetical protein